MHLKYKENQINSLNPFMGIYAPGTILAGVLIATGYYLYAFRLMAAILLIFVPVFILGVDVDSPRNNQ